MFHQTESKPQGWRAIAVFTDERGDALLYLGRSNTQVRAGYAEAYLEVLDDEERAAIKEIQLHHWQGAPDDGHWKQQAVLKVPAPAPAPVKVPDLFVNAAA